MPSVLQREVFTTGLFDVGVGGAGKRVLRALTRPLDGDRREWRKVLFSFRCGGNAALHSLVRWKSVLSCTIGDTGVDVLIKSVVRNECRWNGTSIDRKPC